MGRKTKMNSITSDELLQQVNPKNKELLRDFMGYLRSVKRSETTIAGYESDCRGVSASPHPRGTGLRPGRK